MFSKILTKQHKGRVDLLGAPWFYFDTYYYSLPAPLLLEPVLFSDAFFVTFLSEAL